MTPTGKRGDIAQRMHRHARDPLDVTDADALARLFLDCNEAAAEIERLRGLLNSPEMDDFLEGVKREAAHQQQRWGDAYDRSKSAEHWFWLIGYLSGKALRAAIDGDREKALHHTISSAAALSQWHAAITRDVSGAGVGLDADLEAISGAPHA